MGSKTGTGNKWEKCWLESSNSTIITTNLYRALSLHSFLKQLSHFTTYSLEELEKGNLNLNVKSELKVLDTKVQTTALNFSAAVTSKKSVYLQWSESTREKKMYAFKLSLTHSNNVHLE